MKIIREPLPGRITCRTLLFLADTMHHFHPEKFERISGGSASLNRIH